MQKQEFLQKIQEIISGSRAFKIKLKRENSMGAVISLIEMSREKKLLLKDAEQSRIWTAVQCGRWANELDLTITVVLTENFSKYMFENKIIESFGEHVIDSIEKIEILK